MNRLTYLVFGSILVVTACGGSNAGSNDGGGGHAGAQGGSGGSGQTAGAGGSDTGGSSAGSGGAAGSADCTTATTQATCDAMADCHAVYTSEPRTPVGTCTCPDFGCCTTFWSCASGAHATCTGPVLCKVATPYCEPGYSVANDGTCYVGCVMSSACAP